MSYKTVQRDVHRVIVCSALMLTLIMSVSFVSLSKSKLAASLRADYAVSLNPLLAN